MNHKECKKAIDESIDNICLNYVVNEVLSYIPTGILSKNRRINKDVQRLASVFNQTASNFIKKKQEHIEEIYQNNKDYIEEILLLIIEDISLYNIEAPLSFKDFENIITQNNIEFQKLIKIVSIYYHFNYYRFLSEIDIKKKELKTVFENYKSRVLNYQLTFGGIEDMSENEIKKLSYDKNTFTHSTNRKKVLYEFSDEIDCTDYYDYIDKCIKSYEENKDIKSKYDNILSAISSLKTEEIKIENKKVSAIAEIKEDKNIENQSSSSDENLKNENKNLLKGLMEDWDMGD